MAAFNKASDKHSIPDIEKEYTTLEKIDLTDIGQAIDGNRSKPKDDSFYKNNPAKDSIKLKKFWFW